MGGFGKLPGALPDLYHAFLGLAALSLLNAECDLGFEPNALRSLDPAMCITVEAREWIENLPWRRKLSGED